MMTNHFISTTHVETAKQRSTNYEQPSTNLKRRQTTENVEANNGNTDILDFLKTIAVFYAERFFEVVYKRGQYMRSL